MKHTRTERNLQAEFDNVKTMAHESQIVYEGIAKDLAASRGKLQEAEKALEEYSTHTAKCAIYARTQRQIVAGEWPPCTCGLDAALAEIRKE